MFYNLTERQKAVIRWIVRMVKEEKLPEEFDVLSSSSGLTITPSPEETSPPINSGILSVLDREGLILFDRSARQIMLQDIATVALRGAAYEAVETDFGRLTPKANEGKFTVGLRESERFFNMFASCFTREEINNLCTFNLSSVRYEDIAGDSLRADIRNLMNFTASRGQFLSLVAVVASLRPRIDWHLV